MGREGCTIGTKERRNPYIHFVSYCSLSNDDVMSVVFLFFFCFACVKGGEKRHQKASQPKKVDKLYNCFSHFNVIFSFSVLVNESEKMNNIFAQNIVDHKK